MNNNDLLSRIHDLEAVVNGLMIYIASKEANVDVSDEKKMRPFLQGNVVRPVDVRTAMMEKDGPIAISGDGYWDHYAAVRIPELVEKLKADFPPTNEATPPQE